MDLTTTAYGTWSGGRFMHYGETLSEERYLECIRIAYDAGIRTFVTADVYGNGKADELLGVALAGVLRNLARNRRMATRATRVSPIRNSAGQRAMPIICGWRASSRSNAAARKSSTS